MGFSSVWRWASVAACCPPCKGGPGLGPRASRMALAQQQRRGGRAQGPARPLASRAGLASNHLPHGPRGLPNPWEVDPYGGLSFCARWRLVGIGGWALGPPSTPTTRSPVSKVRCGAPRPPDLEEWSGGDSLLLRAPAQAARARTANSVSRPLTPAPRPLPPSNSPNPPYARRPLPGLFWSAPSARPSPEPRGGRKEHARVSWKRRWWGGRVLCLFPSLKRLSPTPRVLTACRPCP